MPGFLNAMPDADGMLRRIPLLIESDGRIYPGLGLAAVMAATGTHAVAMRTVNANSMSLELDTGAIPLDGRSNLLLRYRGGNHSVPVPCRLRLCRARASLGVQGLAIQSLMARTCSAGDSVSNQFGAQFGSRSGDDGRDNLLRRDFISRPPTRDLRNAGFRPLEIPTFWSPDWVSLAARHRAVSLLMRSGTASTGCSRRGGLSVAIFQAISGPRPVARRHTRADRHPGLGGGRECGARQLMVQSLIADRVQGRRAGRHSRRTRSTAGCWPSNSAGTQVPRVPDSHAHRAAVDARAAARYWKKWGCPDQLLNKPGALTAAEFHEMKKHPAYGLISHHHRPTACRGAEVAIFTMAKDMVETHTRAGTGRVIREDSRASRFQFQDG